MKLIKNYDIMHNKKTIILLNIIGIVLIIPFFYLFGVIAHIITGQTEFSFTFTLWHSLFLLVYFLLIIVHEGIHGLFFKYFKPESKVQYGVKWKSLMAYATSPGSLYSRGQMLVISIAPFVVISLGLTILLALKWLSPFTYWFLVSWHAVGCVGDFYYIYLLLWKHRGIQILAEDTETGIKIFQV